MGLQIFARLSHIGPLRVGVDLYSLAQAGEMQATWLFFIGFSLLHASQACFYGGGKSTRT